MSKDLIFLIMRVVMRRRYGMGGWGVCVGVIMVSLWATVAAQGADCSSITDPYQKAKCAQANIQSTGVLGTGSLIGQQGIVPQYGGTSGCTTAGCAGAAQSGYYSSTGDVGALNAAGANAAMTDPNAARNTDMANQKNGWDVSTSFPVQSANQVSNTWTPSTEVGQTCTISQICIEYADAAPKIEQCTMPGTSRVVCNQNYSPALKPQACGSPPVATPPVDTETFIDGCAPWASLINAGQAALVSKNCTDSATKVLACPDYNTATFLTPTSAWFTSDHSPGTWTGYYGINFLTPIPNGGGGYTFTLNISGNAVSENKYGCTNGTTGGGTVTIPEGGSGSFGGSPPYCNGGCSCGGQPVQFTLGNAVWTGTSFSIPFTYTLAGIASGSLNILGGLTRSSYSVDPANGCWQTTFEYDISTQAPDACQQYRDQGCTQTDSTCTQIDPVSGSCQMYTNTFQCPNGQVCSKTQDVKNCTSCGVPGSLVPFCTDTSTPPNTNFQLAATMMSMVNEVQKDFDKDKLRIFTGTPKHCDFSTIGTVFIDCCANDPSKMLGSCNAEEVSLAADKQAKQALYIGTHCVEWIGLGIGRICSRKEEVYCSFNSELGRIIQVQGRAQLGLNFGSVDVPNCDGFTINQFSALNFAAMDWTEFFSSIKTNFDSAAVSAAMKAKACSLSGASC